MNCYKIKDGVFGVYGNQWTTCHGVFWCHGMGHWGQIVTWGRLSHVVGGWWLVVGGWWLVAGGWWLVVGGWWSLQQ